MLTNNGKNRIKQYLAGYSKTIATSISFGLGAAAESADSLGLDFEISSTPINLITYDFGADRLVFKATIPSDVECVVYEVGLVQGPAIVNTVKSYSNLVTSFDPTIENWLKADGGSVAVVTGTDSRFGDESLVSTVAAGATDVFSLNVPTFDLSEFRGDSKFAVAFKAAANTDYIRLRFQSDSSNYFELNVPGVSAAYAVSKILKSSATITGNPDWANINSIAVVHKAKAAGSSTINLDALRVERDSSFLGEETLIARKVLPTPFEKEAGQPHEIEFSLAIDV